MASAPRLLAGRQGLAAAVLQQCWWQAPAAAPAAAQTAAATAAAAASATAAAQQRRLSSAAASTSGAETVQQQQEGKGAGGSGTTSSSAGGGRAAAGGSSAAAGSAAAAAAAGPNGRLETIEEIRARVFGLHLGDNRRSGRRALLKPLRGKQIATWYFTMGMQPTPLLEDEMETDRLERIVADKASGRAPPKKGQGKRTGKK